MKQKNWTIEEKTLIVMEGIKGKSVSQICAEHGVSQKRYYIWRDKALAAIRQSFGPGNRRGQEERLMRENNTLTTLVGELTVENNGLKKNWGLR